MPSFVIGCVGKPSAGKSTFFNAVALKPNAKVGNYPFTTIEPNQGIGHYTTNCPCLQYKVKCAPRYGTCVNGKRKIPVMLLDVAGLIPGASEGLGLGNKFLDDLRQADILVHILDVSGTTNEKGEQTDVYDPSNDHEWLIEEIRLWIFNNLWKRWPSIARRHIATNSTAVNTLLGQLSGYGAREPLVQEVLDEMELPPSVDFTIWDKDTVLNLVSIFVRRRFKFILALNKADVGDSSDKNALKFYQRYGDGNVVMCSALAECFLRKMKEQNYILYEEGDGNFKNSDDIKGGQCSSTTGGVTLKEVDPKAKGRLNRIRDLVLFRLGSTGVNEVIQKAVDMSGLIPVYPVKNLHRILHPDERQKKVGFPECVLLRPKTTVRKFAKILHAEIDKNFMYAEGPDGGRLGEEDEITRDNNIIRFVTTEIVGK